MGEMRQLFPKDKLDLLEDNFEQSASERQSTREHDREITSSSSTIEVQSLGRQFKIKAGMSKDEQAKLMQFVLDCGGILKTLSTTHDINMKNNVFLRDLFSLTFDHKKECHDISNALVSLSSKIKAIH